MKPIGFFLFVLLIALSCQQPIEKVEGVSKKDEVSTITADEIQISATIRTLFESLSVNGEKQPDFNKVKSLFTNTSYLGYVKNDSMVVKSPDVYFDNMKSLLSKNDVQYLKEWEIKSETKYFGDIAQRTSLYGVHFNTTDTLAERGIMNFQFAKLKGQWKILSMIWKAENDSLKVSQFYF